MATTSGEYVIPKATEGGGGAGASEPESPVIVQIYAVSDVGQTRDHNEDSFVVANLSGGEPFRFERLVEQPKDELGTLFMVADGMGGAAAGEIASATAVDVVLRHLRDGLRGKAKVSPDDFVAEIAKATEIANGSIFNYAVGHPDLRGMGTTATIAALLDDTLYLAQVGDSRAYLMRDGVAIQITKDQSLMQKLIEAGELTEEEALQSDRRNIILQALGPEPIVKLDLTLQQVRREDVLVLCSDGLSGLVRPDQIAQVFGEELDLPSACERLIAMANDLGGPDNITVVAARFVGQGFEVARSADDIGYQVFPLGGEDGRSVPSQSLATQRERPILSAEELVLADELRQRQGERYTRVIASIGAVLLLVLAWKLMSKL